MLRKYCQYRVNVVFVFFTVIYAMIQQVNKIFKSRVKAFTRNVLWEHLKETLCSMFLQAVI